MTHLVGFLFFFKHFLNLSDKDHKEFVLKFLENIIDAINNLISKQTEKLVALIPHFVFDLIAKIKHLPHDIKHLIGIYVPKIRIFILKLIGYTQHYITLIRGQITEFLIYFRSEEFKADKKKALITKPLEYVKNNPLKVATTTSIIATFIFGITLISMNINKIFSATHQERKIASVETAEVEHSEHLLPNEFMMKQHHFEVKIGSAERGGHGGGEGHEEEVVVGDIKFTLFNSHQVEMMEEMEEMVDDYLEAMELSVPNLPVNDEEKTKIEAKVLADLNEGFFTFNHVRPIQKVAIHFHLESRPDYWGKKEKTYSLQNIDLQVFEEDLKRNHQVYIDFSVVASNRNVVLFLKDHEPLIRDRLSTNVEPILPHLPAEDEGKRIIKDKIKDELNQILKDEKIEGKIIEVYLDFSMTS